MLDGLKADLQYNCRPSVRSRYQNLFAKGTSAAQRILIFGVIALLLVVVDTYSSWLKPARSYLEEVAYPVHWLANLPGRVAEWGESSTRSRAELEKENDQLKIQLLVLRGQQQRMAGLDAENIRLRSLLNATEMLKDRLLVAELIGVSPILFPILLPSIVAAVTMFLSARP